MKDRPGCAHGNIARCHGDDLTILAAEWNAGTSAREARNFMRCGVEMQERRNALAPCAVPAALRKNLFERGRGIEAIGQRHRAAINQ